MPILIDRERPGNDFSAHAARDPAAGSVGSDGYNCGMADSSPRRRFQFRLRTLLIAVTVLAGVCAYGGWQEKTEDSEGATSGRGRCGRREPVT